MKKIIASLLLIISIFVLASCAELEPLIENTETECATVTIEKIIEVEKEVIIEKPVEIIKEVEKIIEKPTQSCCGSSPILIGGYPPSGSGNIDITCATCGAVLGFTHKDTVITETIFNIPESEITLFGDYDWFNLSNGDNVTNLFLYNHKVVSAYDITYTSYSQDSSSAGQSFYYGYSLTNIETSEVSVILYYPSNYEKSLNIISGTIANISYKYNQFNQVSEICVTIILTN